MDYRAPAQEQPTIQDKLTAAEDLGEDMNSSGKGPAPILPCCMFDGLLLTRDGEAHLG